MTGHTRGRYDAAVADLDNSDFLFFFFFTLVTGPRRSLSLMLSDTRVYAPEIRTRLGTQSMLSHQGSW